MSTLSVTTIQSNTASTPPVIRDNTSTEIGTFCRAWVNFNGTGTVAIRAAFNVSSITDNGIGDYTANLSTVMPDTSYATLGYCGETASGLNQRISSLTTSGPRVLTTTITTGTALDIAGVYVAVFR